MRRTFLALACSMILALFAGCACDNCNQGPGCHLSAGACGDQQGCQGGPCCQRGCCAPGCAQQQASAPGVVSYPYYTLRGPRDFLETHPQTIGP